MSNFLIDYIASANGLNIATSTPTSSSATGSVGDIAWDSDYIYICTATNTWKRLSIATWGGLDITNASFSQTLSVASYESTPYGMSFKPDGTKLYICGSSSAAYIDEFSLSTAWDISTATYSTTSVRFVGGGSAANNPHGLHFKSDGTEFYMMDMTTLDNRLYQMTASTAWDLSTLSYTGHYAFPSSDHTYRRDVFFKSDGSSVFFPNRNSNSIIEHTLSTAWDVTTINSSVSATFSVSNEGTDPEGLFFSNNGTNMLVADRNTDTINHYSLTTAWDITTASLTASLSISAKETEPSAVYASSDNMNLYICGFNSDSVHQYSL